MHGAIIPSGILNLARLALSPIMPRMMQGTWRSFLFGLLMSLAVGAVVLIVGRRPPGHAVTLREPPTPVPVDWFAPRPVPVP